LLPVQSVTSDSAASFGAALGIILASELCLLFRARNNRHSFAVRRLTLWHEQGADLDQRMLALSTYMGHVKISNTYWYLTGVPELMALAGARFERFANVGESDDA